MLPSVLDGREEAGPSSQATTWAAPRFESKSAAPSVARAENYQRTPYKVFIYVLLCLAQAPSLPLSLSSSSHVQAECLTVESAKEATSLERIWADRMRCTGKVAGMTVVADYLRASEIVDCQQHQLLNIS